MCAGWLKVIFQALPLQHFGTGRGQMPPSIETGWTFDSFASHYKIICKFSVLILNGVRQISSELKRKIKENFFYED